MIKDSGVNISFEKRDSTGCKVVTLFDFSNMYKEGKCRFLKVQSCGITLLFCVYVINNFVLFLDICSA